jgi:formiminoglutamase
VERAQEALAAAVARIVEQGYFPVVLGGGHDLAFGHWLGLERTVGQRRRLGVLSFDAHFDLRPETSGANSGTSFSQIAEHCRTAGGELRYLCIGVQRSANTVRLFRRAEELGVGWVLARDVSEPRLAEVEARIDTFIDGLEAVYVTVCADVMSSAFAPGVSAPQPLGLAPDTVLHLVKHALASGKVVSFDVAEVSPRFDSDNNTAKVAAIFVYALVEGLLSPEQRIR